MPEASKRLKYTDTFQHGAYSALVAYAISHIYFTNQFEMAVSGFVTLGLAFHLSALLDENREMIWEKQLSPWLANKILVSHIALLFFCLVIFGVLYHALVKGQGFGQSQLLQTNFQNELEPLAIHNTLVLVNCFLLAVLFRAGGLMLVLGWNATHWAGSFTEIWHAMHSETLISTSVLGMLVIVPHLILEVTAYILAGLSGLFLSKASTKYALLSPKMKRVLLACIALFIIGAAFCLTGAYVEVKVAQPLFEFVR